ncbi:MAG: type II toxin-antitoxin system RelE/ParE family toxin [Acidobacteria bacterium]|nr:type II toxin-antitoxin system RelE/ParE family toxin [Acidobacteriota bacterium]
MAEFGIELTDEARVDLFFYSASERKLITAGVRAQLLHEPLVTTKNRKLLRTNPIASWELRLGKFRVFYEVDDSSRTVRIVAVGHKEHNQLFVRGEEVKI